MAAPITEWSAERLRAFIQELIDRHIEPKELPNAPYAQINNVLLFDGMVWKPYAPSPSFFGLVPTGTGFRHITAGVEDAAAKLVDTADINNTQVTYAKLQTETDQTLLGRIAGSSGSPQELSKATVQGFLGANAFLPGEPLDQGSVKIATDRFLIQSGQLVLTGSESFELQGTTELVLTDMPGHLENIRGVARSMSEPIVVPDAYDYTVYNQLSLVQTGQLAIRGTGQLILSDVMGTPGQLTLAGRL